MAKILIAANTTWFIYNFRKKTIQRLLNSNHKVYCLAPSDSYVYKLKELGCVILDVDLDPKSTSFFSSLKTMVSIFLKVLLVKPDYIFNSTIKMNIFVGFVSSLLGISFCNNVSGLGTAFIHEGFKYRIARMMYGLANKKAQHVFFENNDDLEFFVSKNLSDESKSSLLPGSGVDVKIFSFVNMNFNVPFKFVMVARLIKDKGVQEYIEAAKILRKEFPSVIFNLVGPAGVSNKTAITESEILHYHDEGIICYHGELEDVRPILIDSHVFVLPSYREGLPKSVLEAQSIGRPAIVTNVPGCRQSINPNVTGWLCELKSSSDLADKMRKTILMDYSELIQFSRHARDWIENKFSDEIVAAEYLKLLN